MEFSPPKDGRGIAFCPDSWYALSAMKNIVSLLLVFFAAVVLCTVLGGVCYMLYAGCASYIMGGGADIVSASQFANGALLCFPISILLAPTLMMLFMIRHAWVNKAVGFAVMCALCVCAWVFLVPFCARDAVDRRVFSEQGFSPLTTGYFRQMDGRVYFFGVERNGSFDGIRFDDRRVHGEEENLEADVFKNRFLVHERDEYGFADPLVSQNLKPPFAAFLIAHGLFSIITNAFVASVSGLRAWLSFSSIMLALVSVAAFVSVSSWRLINALCVITFSVVILALNFSYINFYFKAWLTPLDDLGVIFVFIKNNFQLVMNVCIAFVFTAIGLALALVKAVRGRER